MSTTNLSYCSESINNDDMLKFLRGNVSRSLFISSQSDIDENNSFYSVGVTTPKIISDERDNIILKYLNIDDVFQFSAMKTDNEIKIIIPEMKKRIELYNKKIQMLIHRVENILVPTIADKIVQIPKVQNGLNPLKEILTAVHTLGSLDKQEVYTRSKKKERADDYLKFLSSLNFITIENEIIYPGNEMEKYDLVDVRTKTSHNTLLKEVILYGYRWIKEKLKIQILTPYLELSSAYYLESHFAGQLLHLKPDSIGQCYGDIYNIRKKKPSYQILNNVLELNDAKILKNESKNVFSGYEEIFDQFEDNFPGGY